MDFAGKNVFVTGAGGYIGSFTAKEFAARGAKVAVFDRNAEGVEKTVGEINAAGGLFRSPPLSVITAAAIWRIIPPKKAA